MSPMLVSPPFPTPQISVGSLLTPKWRKAPGFPGFLSVCVEYNFHSIPCLLFQKSLYPSITALIMSYATLSPWSERGHSSATVLIHPIPPVSFPGHVCSHSVTPPSQGKWTSLLWPPVPGQRCPPPAFLHTSRAGCLHPHRFPSCGTSFILTWSLKHQLSMKWTIPC